MKILTAILVALALATGATFSLVVSETAREPVVPAGQNSQNTEDSPLGAATTEIYSDDLLPPSEPVGELPNQLDEPELNGSPEIDDGASLSPVDPGSPEIVIPIHSPPERLPDQSSVRANQPAERASTSTPNLSRNSTTAKASGNRLIIREINVDAPLVRKAVDKTGRMPEPDGNDEVVFYNFSSMTGYGGTPGKGGNSVFGGHVDSDSKPCHDGTMSPPCPSVFWDLGKVKIGTEIVVRISGTDHRYRVRSTESVSTRANWSAIVAATPQESITIITCDGDFDQKTRSYDRRLVVRAVRKT